MKIEVKGHSGCAVDIVREGTKLYIDKKTSSPGYFPRLIAQARKQQRAAGLFHTPSIVVPEILAVNQSSGMVSVKMEYIYSMNFVEYFEYAGFYQIMHFIDALKALLSEEISLSAMTRIKRDVLADKFIDVRSKCRNNPALCDDPEVSLLLEGLETIFLAGMNDFEIPAGTCHGDLTFSNILFSGNNYYLIDFLDSFVETPLMDIVKIRQDTAFGWSLLMYDRTYDKIRMKIILGKIDAAIHECFSRYAWYRQYYPVFQLMNFLRILQYAREPRVIDYLKTIIKRLSDEFQFDCPNRCGQAGI